MASLVARARAELELRYRRYAEQPLVEYVRSVSGEEERYLAPNHLRPFADLFDATETSEQRVLVSVPPRHAKTETILHGIAKRLRRQPRTRIAYISYGDSVARDKGMRARDVAYRAGVDVIKDVGGASNWRTRAGGQLYCTGIGGPLTSFGFDLIIVDDPHKNRAEVESGLVRRTIREWLTSTAFTRIEPGGSAIICHTRWHPDDLIGSLENKPRWRSIALPAVSASGHALWPERWSMAALHEKREDIGEYDWASLYMCSPRPRGGAVFGDVHFINEADLPERGRIVIGIDFAYSTKTHSDYSVAVVMTRLEDGRVVILEVLRIQVAPPAFARQLVALKERYREAAFVAYVGGQEGGIVDLFAEPPYKLRIAARPAYADKFTRAQRYAAAWNHGKVLLLHGGMWADAFVSEHAAFTGVHDLHDDQIDAAVAAFDMITKRVPKGGSAPPIESRGSFDSRGLHETF